MNCGYRALAAGRWSARGAPPSIFVFPVEENRPKRQNRNASRVEVKRQKVGVSIVLAILRILIIYKSLLFVQRAETIEYPYTRDHTTPIHPAKLFEKAYRERPGEKGLSRCYPDLEYLVVWSRLSGYRVELHIRLG